MKVIFKLFYFSFELCWCKELTLISHVRTCICLMSTFIITVFHSHWWVLQVKPQPELNLFEFWPYYGQFYGTPLWMHLVKMPLHPSTPPQLLLPLCLGSFSEFSPVQRSLWVYIIIYTVLLREGPFLVRSFKSVSIIHLAGEQNL